VDALVTSPLENGVAPGSNVYAELGSTHLGGDRVARQRAEYRQQPDPSFVTYGPKTRLEFLILLSWERG
jgi:hypothetical protein